MQFFTSGTADPVCSVCVRLSPITAVSGPVRKRWGAVRVWGEGDAWCPPATKGIVIIVLITNVEEMSVPTRHRILQDNEKEQNREVHIHHEACEEYVKMKMHYDCVSEKGVLQWETPGENMSIAHETEGICWKEKSDVEKVKNQSIFLQIQTNDQTKDVAWGYRNLLATWGQRGAAGSSWK